MAYDDVIRVADLKTRDARFIRIRGEMAAGNNPDAPDRIHAPPRRRRLSGMLPRQLGRTCRGQRDVDGPTGPLVRTRPPRAHRQSARLSDALCTGRHETPPPWHAAPRARSGASGALAGCRTWLFGRQLRSGGRSPPLPPSGEGLFRHPRPWPVEIRPGAGRRLRWSQGARTQPTGHGACAKQPCKDEKGKALDGALATIHSFV